MDTGFWSKRRLPTMTHSRRLHLPSVASHGAQFSRDSSELFSTHAQLSKKTPSRPSQGTSEQVEFCRLTSPEPAVTDGDNEWSRFSKEDRVASTSTP